MTGSLRLHRLSVDVRPGDAWDPPVLQLWREGDGRAAGTPCGNLTADAARDLARQLLDAADELDLAEHARRGVLRMVPDGAE